MRSDDAPGDRGSRSEIPKQPLSRTTEAAQIPKAGSGSGVALDPLGNRRSMAIWVVAAG